MKVTWLGHAGIRVEQDGYTLVVDPGIFCDEAALGAALAAADGLLITHEHPDHLAEEAVGAALERKPQLEVWTNRSLAEQFAGRPGTVHAVGDEDAFTAGPFDVQAYGEWHAEIHRDVPRVLNTGFLIGGKVFHPGDALTHPAGVSVELLLTPLHGPWTKSGDLIDFIREVKPARVSPIHDAMLGDMGKGFTDAFLSPEGGWGPPTGAPYSRMVLGEPFEL
jgi:L-ascorbate metabolism protein UlaG (beta-lactamase superfamily)